MTVALAARPLGDIVIPRLSDEEYLHFTFLMQTKGSRQYMGSPFEFDWLPNVTSYYGYRIHPISGAVNLHRGLDIGAVQGTRIRSGQDGTVIFAGYSGDFGNVVVIDDGKGLVSKYAHCETLLVAEGQAIKMGDAIATVGSTGSSTGPHLHLEVLKDGLYRNPLFFTDAGGFSLMPE
jgi:murein DD-endopeptidase MepM/ murein hydrolase activator NlpD